MIERDDEENHSSAFSGDDPGGSEKEDGSLLKIGITPSALVTLRLGFTFVTVHNGRVK